MSVETAEVKERARSSFGSQEGTGVSGVGGSLSLWSCPEEREEIFLFFEEDVMKASRRGSSGGNLG